ncbi:hypothetical protein V1512DRAFT_277415 [Lipomyces arxii]|uniref:uncharacterized protein n=1 Tax=Lipomyces arxii TaxID=56418 RepID=UPI0034CFC3F9
MNPVVNPLVKKCLFIGDTYVPMTGVLEVHWTQFQSRIIVKNLPLNLSDDRFREHFAEHGGIITDCKLMRTRSGMSRRFGFIGFKSAQDATDAANYFNHTFIGMTKIEVDLAKNINDPTIPKPRRELEQTSQFVHSIESDNRKRRKVGDESTETANPKLREFIDVMKSRGNERTWANDDFVGESSVNASEPEQHFDEKASKFTSVSTKNKKVEEKEEVEVEVRADEVSEEEKPNLAATEMTDDEWLRARRTRIPAVPVGDSTIDEAEQAEENDAPVVPPAESEVLEEKSEQDVNLESIRSTRRLFVRNLSYGCTEEDLAEIFGQYGELEEVHIPVDKETHNSKGFSYLLFVNGDDACNAYTGLDRQSFQGRLLHVLPGQPKRENKMDEFELSKLPLKKQLELKRKATAAKNQFAWSSLYMNADAVVESLASKMGVTKSDLLDPDSTDAAVRQAMAEAHAIDDAKRYFEAVGMDLNAFSDTQSGRSDTVILVKNFPFDTTIEEIRDAFSEHGEVRRVLMPPSNTIAVVEMATVPQARAAFTKLAYRRFKSSIIYLEKAPKNLLKSSSSLPIGPSAAQEKAKKAKVTAADLNEVEDEEDSGPGVGSTSLFVKNLNFKTRTNDLTAAFSPLQDFIRAEVKMKRDTKNQGQWLSMGFGFVEFKNKESADMARRAMADFVLDGHKLEIKLSSRGSDAPVEQNAKSKVAPKTKIIIKNLPFEASKKDIRQLFGAFGQLRTVRLPRKFDNSARGFAFAEFVSAKEAESAMEALAGVHLLGRRLVLQYAAQDAASAEEEIERMQKKVRKQVAGEKIASYSLSGKRKFNIDGNEDEEMDG